MAEMHQFYLGVNWGSIRRGIKEKSGFLGLGSRIVDVDMPVEADLSCVMTDDSGALVDTLCSPSYNPVMFRLSGLPVGKEWSADGSMCHGKGETHGVQAQQELYDKEFVKMDMSFVRQTISQIYFILNIFEPKDSDFSEIKEVSLRLCEGTTPEGYEDLAITFKTGGNPAFRGKNALVLAKFSRDSDTWKFDTIGKAYDDGYDLRKTIKRLIQT